MHNWPKSKGFQLAGVGTLFKRLRQFKTVQDSYNNRRPVFGLKVCLPIAAFGAALLYTGAPAAQCSLPYP